MHLSGYHSAIQLFCCCFNPVQRVSCLQPTGTSVFELSGLPHAFFYLADLFLIYEEKVGHLAEPHNLGGEREVMNMFQHIVKLRSLVSAVLETPEVVVRILWSFSLIMVRECIQGSSILTPISQDNTYDMWARAHDDPGVTRQDASPLTVGDNAGDEVGPAVEVES